MSAISLTTFVDFMNKSGTPKMTVVREWKHRDEYHPGKDYWKVLRDAIIDMHRKGQAASTLSATPPRDRPSDGANYAETIRAYKKWVGKRALPWFTPPKLTWHSGTVDVLVNPELGLEIDGTKHLVKLYFKADKLPANRAALVLQMIHESIDAKGKTVPVMALLDVRKGKLHTLAAPVKEYGSQLLGEAAYWAAIYPTL